MNKNKYLMFTAIVIIVIWMIVKYIEGRKLRENYEMNKDGLLEYIENEEKLDSVYIMTNVAKLTKDDDTITKSYDLAEADDRDNLVKIVNSL